MATLSKRRAALLAGGSLVLISAHLNAAWADQDAPLGEVDITATRTEQPVANSASAITVISPQQVQTYGATGLTNVLRGTPGLDIWEFGGVGTLTSVSLRGSSTGQVLVLIDGVRANNPTDAGGAVDFGGFTAAGIERIEVLRGPQSALYGSDAMGGVINIITKKGGGASHGSALIEGGAYGTVHSRVEQAGSSGDWTYSFSLDGLHVDGFPRFGYRVKGPIILGGAYTGYFPLPPMPSMDITNKLGGAGQVAWHPTEDLTVTAGALGYSTFIKFDNSSATIPENVYNGFSRQNTSFAQGYLRVDDDSFAKKLHSRLTLSANQTNMVDWVTQGCYDASYAAFNCKLGYLGGRYGAEYQGDAKLDAFGLVTFGGRTDTETLTTSQDPYQNFTPQDDQQTTNSAFAQHQFTLFDRLDLTYGGRIDAVQGNTTFDTWRTTAAYRIEETGTKLRATAGTGAKVATLFQRYSIYGSPNLQPEQSFGWDAGVDQTFLGGLVNLGATYYYNDYRNLINFGPAPNCTPTQVAIAGGCYYNIGRARTQGVELSGDVAIVPESVKLRASYTYLDARNLVTNAVPSYRPHNKGSASVIYTGVPKLEVEARVTVVGANPAYDYTFHRNVTIPAYAKFDLFANYKLDHGVSVFGRMENLTDIRYQNAYLYGTPGRSVYGGVKYEW
ncbi:TonB-dependent receptor [Rhodoblastus acidophilus]|uniref:TonB-dependent receptor n=1 Tax=Rhodoblastus acidophilus TaxID=1074 RepID=A0A6N8DS85_RHOAC|nr:TonB-dependent receptor [Rhodoblastus acidophilus]MCW2274819.1 vitamin B12 transporter [Rhodoblastus acidophilus]MTV33267.1 TonB-dependent receptor [Rhodoblastus acidophilus]